MTHAEVMQQALEALEGFTNGDISASESFEQCNAAITALREALAQQEQPRPSQYGSPELQAMIVDRAMNRAADVLKAQPEQPVTDCHATGVCVQSGLRAEKPAQYSDIVSDGGLDPRNRFDKPAQEPAPGYCKHYKQFTIEEPLPAQEPIGIVRELFTQAAWERLDLRGSTKVYLGPQPQRQPLTSVRVKELLTRAGYDDAAMQSRADFICGLRYGEGEHGITGDTK